MYKSGFISVVGRTNAGKSSLINYLLNTKLTMVSHKQNATRRLLKAIVMFEKNQLIFIDTPGLNKSAKMLNKILNERAISSFDGCDAVLFCASVFDELSIYEEFLLQNVKQPHIIALTKIDLCDKIKLFSKLEEYSKFSDKFSAIVPVSIKKQSFAKELLNEVVKLLPFAPYYYDEEIISDTISKDIYREFILEAIFSCVSDELPYSAEVIIKEVKEGQKVLYISAKIITDTNSHKGIFISALKNIGIKARKQISAFCSVKVYLSLFVEVEENWIKKEKKIKKFLK